MLFKLLHYFVLLCYVNLLAYEANVKNPVLVDDSLLNGESILEFVLDDVLDMPVDKTTKDVELHYDEYNSSAYQQYTLLLFVLILGLSFSFKQIAVSEKHPVYDAKKRQIIPGYYTFLYRLKPF